ncbi:hypothetical protein GE061_007935 [Apolygus lucorum]|uniref:WH2 domain-containing protein n=1 Tax=Apolygus lucorum TaxID=248454 RepID=A0A8S9WPY3_APOLU|nr:hypothetical protein GE061_007935 [Apolygus lucorum]
MKPAQSTSCLAPSRKKKPAPPPPVLAIAEEEREDIMPARSSRTLPPGARLIDETPVEPPVRPTDPSSRLSPPPIAPSVESKGKPHSYPVDVSIPRESIVSPKRSGSQLSYACIQDESPVHSLSSSPEQSPNKLQSAANVHSIHSSTAIHPSAHINSSSRIVDSPVHSYSNGSPIHSLHNSPVHANIKIPPDPLSKNIPSKLPPPAYIESKRPLLEELNSTLKQAQVAPDTQLISVRDLLKKFADSEKPLPNFKLTTYNPDEVRKITKYSETGTSYYNYDLKNVRSIDSAGSPSQRRSILKIANKPNPEFEGDRRFDETQNGRNSSKDTNQNKIMQVYSDIPSNQDVKRVVHTKKGGGVVTSNIRNIYEREDSEEKTVDHCLKEELDNITAGSRVKHIVEVYSDMKDSFESDTSDLGKEKPKKIILDSFSTQIDVSNNNVETSKIDLESRKRAFLENIISESKRDENSNVGLVEAVRSTVPAAVDDDTFSEKEFNPFPTHQESGSSDSSFDLSGDAAIEEINRALDSVAYDDADTDDSDFERSFAEDFSGKSKSFRVSPVIGVQKIEEVFDEYATEFTNIPIVIIRDEDDSEHPFDHSLGNGSMKGALSPPPQELQVDLEERPRSPLKRPKSPLQRMNSESLDTIGSPKRFERSDSIEIGGFEGPKSGMCDDVEELERGLSSSIKSKICFAKEESLELVVLKDFTEPRDDNMSLSSNSSGGTLREIKDDASKVQTTLDAQDALSSSSIGKGKTVTFSPQPRVCLIQDEDTVSVSSQQTLSKKKSAIFSPKIKFEDLKRRGKKLFSSMKKSNAVASNDWNHKDVTEPGFCDCEDPDVMYVRVPKSGKRNQAFKIKDKRSKKVTFARSDSNCSKSSETANQRLKQFLDSKEGELGISLITTEKGFSKDLWSFRKDPHSLDSAAVTSSFPPKPARRLSLSRPRKDVFDRLEFIMKRRSLQEGLTIVEEQKINPTGTLSDFETERVEDEIERMFEEATREHVSLESGVDVGDSSPGIPSPEASGLPSPELIPDPLQETLHKLPDSPLKEEEDPFNWEYKLPAPPTFRDVVERDDSSSASMTEYSTMTVGKMKEVLYQPSAAGDRPEPPKVIGVMERRAVVQELATVIEAPTRGLAAPKEPEAPKTKPVNEKILDNFKITTYSGTREPVKVFQEKSSPKRYETNLARRSSFTDKDSTEKKMPERRAYMSGGVKRSISHVSPLARARLGLSVSNSDLMSAVEHPDEEDEPVFHRARAPLRKTTSELSINIDLSDEKDEDFVEKQERHNGLQSLNVLKSILPHLSRSQGALNHIESSNSEKTTITKEYQGPARPNISISTWGERPKRQISIKSDRDYVIGGVKVHPAFQNGVNGSVNGFVAPLKPPAPAPKPQPPEKPTAKVAKTPSFKGPKTLAYKMLETGNTKPLKQILERDKFPGESTKRVQREQDPVETPAARLESDHVPIVRAVELKKPYKMELENRMIKDPVPPPSLPVETKPEPPVLRRLAKSETPRMVIESPPRPVSCYLFGYEPSVGPKSPPNPPPPPKKYTSIVDLSQPVALKPVSSRSLKPRQREVDPREELLASIRTFGKNSLRKVSAR